MNQECINELRLWVIGSSLIMKYVKQTDVLMEFLSYEVWPTLLNYFVYVATEICSYFIMIDNLNVWIC